MASRTYTAQEMREQADHEEQNEGLVGTVEMLRQAAEMRERLDAVVKVAKEQFEIIYDSPMCWDEDENEFHSLEQLKEMDALEMVVATARGDAGKEQ